MLLHRSGSALARCLPLAAAARPAFRCLSGAPAAAAPAAPAPAAPAPTRGGSLYVWGRISEGKLGMRAPESAYNMRDHARPGGPFVLPLLNPSLANVTEVVCRQARTMALTADGSVYSWGTCDNASLGHGDKVTALGQPRKIEALAGIRIVHIDAGETSAVAVSDEGEVFTWGWGGTFFRGNGGLGHGNNVTQPLPALVEALEGTPIASVAVGSTHMVALARDGTAWTWGSGEYGRCGNGRSSQPLPAPVALLTERGARCLSVAAGGAHSLAATAAGEVWGWGKNETSQLGLGAGLVADLHNMEDYPALVEVEGHEAALFNAGAQAVAAGSTHSLALCAGGRVWQWGARTFLAPTLVPKAVLSPEAKARAGAESAELALVGERIIAGDAVSGVIDREGRLFTWGMGMHSSALGQHSKVLGTPALVDLPGRVLRASLGSHHGAAVVL